MFFGSWAATCKDLIEKATGKEQLKVNDDEEQEPGQDHVFTFCDSLSKEEKAQLDEDFDDVRVDEMQEAWLKALEMEAELQAGLTLDAPALMNWDLKKPPALKPGANITKEMDVNARKVAAWRQAGLQLYHQARVAIIILSGGMDARLGEGLPKGAMDIGLLSHKSIFQLYIERIRRVQHLVYRKHRRAIHIPVYIMCNRQNRSIIEVFFRENNFFGIREQDLMLFTQGMAAVVDRRGKLLLADKHRIAMYPNGNGGVFRALMEQGMVSDMKSRGVTALFMCSIDNLLAKVGDPVFVGLSEVTKTEVAIKCVEKLSPEETFGVFCSKTILKHDDIDGDGKLDIVSKVKAHVLEFFEIPEDLRSRRVTMTNGLPPLRLGIGNLSQYYFKVDFVRKAALAGTSSSRRWHRIAKHFPYTDLKTGEQVNPPKREQNAYRLELFLFDSFELARAVVGLQVEREEFALVKNLQGPDSPSTALQAMGKLHQKWIWAAGGVFQDTRQSTEREDAKVEISPLVSFAGEDLEGQFPEIIQLPFYLPSQQETLEFSAASSAQTRRPSTHYLDWYSDLAQRELEVELQAKLGPILEMIEDGGRTQYTGERAEDEEALPPTPPQEDEVRVGGMNKRHVKTRKGEEKHGEEDAGSEAEDEEAEGAAGAQEKMKSLTAGSPPGICSFCPHAAPIRDGTARRPPLHVAGSRRMAAGRRRRLSRGMRGSTPAAAAAAAVAWAICARQLASAQQIKPYAGKDYPATMLVEVDDVVRRMGIVLDANYRWLFNAAESTTCSSGIEAEMEACVLQHLDKESLRDSYGIELENAGYAVSLRYAALGRYATKPNYGTRAFLTDHGLADDTKSEGTGYYMFKLLNRELSFKIDLSNVPAGMNAALYFVSMDSLGNLGAASTAGVTNNAGWKRGVGYCDAQCPTDLKFVQGLGYRDPGTAMSCCDEMDIFEGNRMSVAMTAHPCASAGQTTCDTTKENCINPCDTDGADVNLFRRYGPDQAVFELIDPKKPVTIRTQFLTNGVGELAEIRQIYEQNYRDGTVRQFSMNISDASVAEQKALFGEDHVFARVGGLAQMGRAIDRGMVLTLAIWSDTAANMNWLDSCTSNVTKTGYECANHSQFSGSDTFAEAWEQAPGVWRGPADYLPDLSSSFADESVSFTYPRIPTWMATQGPFRCPQIGISYDCAKVPYRMVVSDLKVAPLEGTDILASPLHWYFWLISGIIFALLAMVACSLFIGKVLGRKSFGALSDQETSYSYTSSDLE